MKFWPNVLTIGRMEVKVRVSSDCTRYPVFRSLFSVRRRGLGAAKAALRASSLPVRINSVHYRLATSRKSTSPAVVPPAPKGTGPSMALLTLTGSLTHPERITYSTLAQH